MNTQNVFFGNVDGFMTQPKRKKEPQTAEGVGDGSCLAMLSSLTCVKKPIPSRQRTAKEKQYGLWDMHLQWQHPKLSPRSLRAQESPPTYPPAEKP